MQSASDTGNRWDDSNERIQKLETYIKRLGGDPKLLEQTAADRGANFQQSHALLDMTGSRSAETRSSSVADETISSAEKNLRGSGKRRGLVEHDEQLTYTDVCV